MVLHPSATDELPGRNAMQKSTIRRRRSKGTIAGFAFAKSDATISSEMSGGEIPDSGSQGNVAGSNSPNNPPQHSGEKNAPPAKPCSSAHLALLCIQNTLRMGPRTQLFLCPPGRSRRDLQTQLKEHLKDGALYETVAGIEYGGYYNVDRMLGTDTKKEYNTKGEDFLLNANTFSVDSDEEASSGDDDDLNAFDSLFSEERGRSDEDKYSEINEPLFTPVISNPNDAPMASMGRGGGKLPFNRRKLRLFDLITADDREKARVYLRQEMQKSRKRQGYLLSRHLRRMQREEMRRKRQEAGEPTDDLADSDNEAPPDIYASVGQLEGEMTPALAAALLLESLAMNPIESLEGMAKCYEGIVDAGVAVIDAQTVDPTKPAGADEKARATRSEVMAALAPLLITSLEQPSGEVILLLAKLRRMCGTARYQRRFVQRVAPALIRPPRGAMWCLRHQNDMEAILTAAELIFDSAFDVFSKGWHERGRLMLADSKRAKTLQSAAVQLRNLSSEPSEGLGRGPRRRRTLAKKGQDKTGGATEPLAEWEIIAVDRQIRISISNVMSNDWSRSLLQSDSHKNVHRRPALSSKRYGALMHSSSTDMSPKPITSPRSPARITSFGKSPISPPHMPGQPSSGSSASESIENVFGPAFSSQSVSTSERVPSPPPPPSLPHSPAATRLHQGRSLDEQDQVSPQSPKRDVDVPDASRAPLSPKPSISPSSAKIRPKDSQMISLDSIKPTSPAPVGSFKDNSIQGSITSTLTPLTSQSNQYRTLTSTAAERKRTVAACRALSAQIQRFERAFIQLHGRPPKGTAERAPLATTYAQYREWKRAIRADAACRIQALLRGARTRLMLLRSKDPEASRVILRRAGRPNDRPPDLNLPVDISDSDQDPSAQSGADSDSSGPPSSKGLHPAPQWPLRTLRPRVDLGERPSPYSEPTMPRASRSPSPPSTPTQQGSIPSDLSIMSLPDLQARKRDLKQQLKQYDMNFARRHGRMPVKAEKEPIRHLYEAYNALKNQINSIEKEGRHIPGAVSQISASRASSPTSASETSSYSGAEEIAAKVAPVPARSTRDRRRVPIASIPPVAAISTPPGAPSQDLAALKAEKSQLHQMLRSYEKDFFREHNRQVSSFADIKPVAAQYRRYKEIKKAIAALQKEK